MELISHQDRVMALAVSIIYHEKSSPQEEASSSQSAFPLSHLITIL